jgi:hypothetical protein
MLKMISVKLRRISTPNREAVRSLTTQRRRKGSETQGSMGKNHGSRQLEYTTRRRYRHDMLNPEISALSESFYYSRLQDSKASPVTATYNINLNATSKCDSAPPGKASYIL